MGRSVSAIIALSIGWTLIPAFCQAIKPASNASASALAEITILSDSPADFSLSPLIATQGVSLSWQRPFGLAGTDLIGIHSAFGKGSWFLATGLDYLSHSDYRWQDEYLSLGMAWEALKLGATQHLIYEKIESESWFTWDNDFALAFVNEDYGSELRINNLRSQDTSFTLSASSQLSKQAKLASRYTWNKAGQDSYALATTYQVISGFQLSSSWQSEPNRFGLGMKLSWDRLNLFYSVQTHPELSLTHSLNIGSNW